MLSCTSSLKILDTNPLLDILFANTFFHSVGSLLVLLVVSFAVQKVLLSFFFLGLHPSTPFFFLNLFLFLAASGLSCGTQNLFVVVRGLSAVACGLLSSCSLWAPL